MFVWFIIFLVLTVILVLVSRIDWSSFIIDSEGDYKKDINELKAKGKYQSDFINKIILGVGIGFGVLALMFIIFASLYVVQPGQVGVQVLFGKVQKFSESGISWKNPLANVIYFDVRTVKYEVKLEGASQDMQQVGMFLALNYRLNYEGIGDLYNKVGKDYEVKVIEPAVQGLSKACISKYKVEDVIVKRSDLATDIFNSLKDRLEKYYIILENVSINNIEFAAEFTKTVEEKQIEEQKIKTAEYKKLQAKQVAEQTVIEANAEAERNLIEARAEAEKQRLLRNNTSKAVIELKWIDKWDGKLPTFITGGNTVPMINFKQEE